MFTLVGTSNLHRWSLPGLGRAQGVSLTFQSHQEAILPPLSPGVLESLLPFASPVGLLGSWA